MALILYRLGFIVLGVVVGVFLLLTARRVRLRWWPALVIRLILTLAVMAAIFSPRGQFLNTEFPGREIIIVDYSVSVDPTVLAQLKSRVSEWAAVSAGRLVILATDTPTVLLNPAADWPPQSTSDTDLEKALRSAKTLLANTSGKIILASDGQITNETLVGEAITELAQKYSVELLAIPGRSNTKDRILQELIAPTHQWENTPFEVQVPVVNASADDIDYLQVIVNGEEVNDHARQLNPGLYGFRIPAQQQGTLFIQVSLNVPGDPNPENNLSFGVVRVYSTPSVLIVSSDEDRAVKLTRILAEESISAEIIQPQEIPLNINELQKYKVIFLHNLLASNLTFEMMNALKIYVTELGGGLIFLGGNHAFTLGDYQNTILEPLMPVQLEPPPRPNRVPITFLLILDRSGSMRDEIQIWDVKSIDLAREAAMRSLETTRPDDYLGVITYETDVFWDIPFQRLGEGIQLRKAMDTIASIEAGGTTSMYRALSAGLQGLYELPSDAPKSKHILLLTDGRSSDGSDEKFKSLAQEAKDAGIMISTIGLGEKIDAERLRMLADDTGGRYYLTSSPLDLPQIMVAESEAIRSENIQVGQTTLLPGEDNHPVLSGMELNRLPSLGAYNALTSKADQGAEDILNSANYGDPILSIWQYGLGRVAAWMSDIGEIWTQPWSDSETESLFWSQLVRYTLVNPAIGPVQVEIQPVDDNLEVNARIEDKNGVPINLAQFKFNVLAADGEIDSYTIPQSAPGNYTLILPRPDPGAYQASITYTEKAGEITTIDAPFVVNPLTEDLSFDVRIGEKNLTQWNSIGSIRSITLDELGTIVGDLRADTSSDSSNYFWLFLLGLVLAWPLEIAIRRQWLPWLS